MSHCGKLRVTGQDRVRYLHNMLSNDIRRLRKGEGCYAALLTHQGRIESDVYVLADVEEFWLECSPAATGRLIGVLNKYIVADAVTVEDWSERLAMLSLQGPGADRQVESILGVSLEGTTPFEHRLMAQGASSRRMVRRDRSGAGGYDVWVPREDAAELWTKCIQAGIVPAGYRALDMLRTEAGIPWFGIDMDDRRLPMEMGLTSAISLTKGCYRGQEIVARVTHRGHLDRKLGAVAMDQDGEPPRGGSEVRSGDIRVGEVTSATFSPRLGRPLCLAILKLEFLEPGIPVHAVSETVREGRTVKVPLTT
jgi:folate-binding protein YgfZ